MRRLATLILLLNAVGCGVPKPPPHTVGEFTAEPALLQGVIDRCAANRESQADVECARARAAVEQMAAAEEERHQGARRAEFERRRDQRRASDGSGAQLAAPAGKFDPYSSPVSEDASGTSPKP